MAAKTAAKTATKTSGNAAKQELVASKDGRIVRIIRGVSCLFCGGPTYLATLGPKRPAVRVCDSKWVADDLRAKIRHIEAEIGRLAKEQDDAVLRGLELEELVAMNDAVGLKKLLGLKPKATDEELMEAIENARAEIIKVVAEKEKAAEAIPEKEAEIRKLADRLARMNEFCLAIMGWRDDRIIVPPQQLLAAA